MNGKGTEQEKIRKEMREKIGYEQRNKILTGVYGRIISMLARRLIQHEGYSVVNTIMRREIKEIGRHDAKVISKAFDLNNTPEDASKALKIAALIIGYNLDVEEDETVVKGCPFANLAVEMREPALCNICTEYVNGITEGILGKNFEMKATHDITQEVPRCFFRLKKL